MVLTGFDDTNNQFHILFKRFSVSSISRVLNILSDIVPTSQEWRVKLATFSDKRDKLLAASLPPKPTGQGKKIPVDFSDEDDDSPPPPPAKRQKPLPSAPTPKPAEVPQTRSSSSHNLRPKKPSTKK